MQLSESAPIGAVIPALPAECEDCARRIIGMDGIIGSDGKARHKSCHESAESGGTLGLKVFEVKIRFVGYTTMEVCAKDAAEAEKIAMHHADSSDFIEMESEACDSTTPLEMTQPSKEQIDERDAYLDAMRRQREAVMHRRAEREAQRLLANRAIDDSQAQP